MEIVTKCCLYRKWGQERVDTSGRLLDNANALSTTVFEYLFGSCHLYSNINDPKRHFTISSEYENGSLWIGNITRWSASPKGPWISPSSSVRFCLSTVLMHLSLSIHSGLLPWFSGQRLNRNTALAHSYALGIVQFLSVGARPLLFYSGYVFVQLVDTGNSLVWW